MIYHSYFFFKDDLFVFLAVKFLNFYICTKKEKKTYRKLSNVPIKNSIVT